MALSRDGDGDGENRGAAAAAAAAAVALLNNNNVDAKNNHHYNGPESPASSNPCSEDYGAHNESENLDSSGDKGHLLNGPPSSNNNSNVDVVTDENDETTTAAANNNLSNNSTMSSASSANNNNFSSSTNNNNNEVGRKRRKSKKPMMMSSAAVMNGPRFLHDEDEFSEDMMDSYGSSKTVDKESFSSDGIIPGVKPSISTPISSRHKMKGSSHGGRNQMSESESYAKSGMRFLFIPGIVS